jgi:hypothetical protein
MIYPLTIVLILMGGAASAAILIIAAWDADFDWQKLKIVKPRQLAASHYRRETKQ